MIFSVLVPLPLLIGLAELYFGHPDVAGINGLQMAANSAGWVALLVTWKYFEKLNRQTATAFDERIQELREKSRLVKLNITQATNTPPRLASRTQT